MGANSYICRSYRGKTGRGSWIELMVFLIKRTLILNIVKILEQHCALWLPLLTSGDVIIGKSAYGALSEWYYTDGKKGSYIDDPGDYRSCSSGCCSAKCVKCKARTTKSKQKDSKENNKHNLNSLSYKNNDQEPKNSVEVISQQENIYIYHSISNKIEQNWLCYIYTIILCYVYR